MAKVKKYQLTFDPEYDYEMIGISSHHHDYRLAWNINKHLNFQLSYSAEHFTFRATRKKVDELLSFTMFDYSDDENKVNYYLIKNKEAGKLLIPECPSIDYFLFIHEKEMVDREIIVKKLREVPSILAVFQFEPEEFTSTENIFF